MGVSRDSTQFAGKIVAGGVAISGANKVATAAAAQGAKTTILAVAGPDTGGDMRLSRWGKNGVKVDAGYEITTAGPDMSIARITPRPLGVWRVLNDGADPHPIVPGASRGVRRAGASLAGAAGPTLPASTVAGARRGKGSRRVLSFGAGRGVAAYAKHPGTKGKGTWRKGVEAARPAATNAYQTTHRRALLGAFR